jgi:hypothetical protein
MTFRPLVPLLLLALVPPAARAQKRPVPVADAPPPPEYEAPREMGWAGGSLVLALPTGEFKRYVNAGGGLSGFAAFKLGRESAVSLRLDGTYLIYGIETRRVTLGPGPLALVGVDVRTSNSIVNFVVGPQLTATRGALRPYLFGGIGFSYFWTYSSVSGTNNAQPFASSTNFDDGSLALRGGGGLWLQVGHGRTPIWIDLGAEYVRNGRLRYLREGSITFDATGNPVYSPIESETNLVLVHLGVAVGLRPRR